MKDHGDETRGSDGRAIEVDDVVALAAEEFLVAVEVLMADLLGIIKAGGGEKIKWTWVGKNRHEVKFEQS